jgi:hypothetical protein
MRLIQTYVQAELGTVEEQERSVSEVLGKSKAPRCAVVS